MDVPTEHTFRHGQDIIEERQATTMHTPYTLSPYQECVAQRTRPVALLVTCIQVCYVQLQL